MALLHAPATARNREPILAVLREILPATGTVLEIASGSGEHAVFFASALPGVVWQPTDPDPDARASIDARREADPIANLRAPLALDAASSQWPIDRADAIVCINMIHIAPWSAAKGLMRGAGSILPPGGALFLYGPYKEGGVHTSDSNLAFDESLRSRDPSWGVRDRDDVIALAADNGLQHEKTVLMPANNRSIVFRRV